MASSAEAAWAPKANPWAIAVVVALAAFMEILDTSIANVALPHIAGNLGATNDESTWVLTSYLVSNAIVLPVSGWLAGLFGRQRFFLLCIVMFTLSSLLCGLASSLALLIVFRIVQGIGGGGLQPMAQAILADTFPPEKRGVAFALYGITAIIAPTVGPTLGGWITDNYTWRWIFLMNLPVGVLAVWLVARLVEDPPFLTAARRAGVTVDYLGIALLVLGVGALQVMLDKGQEDDWFGSHFIVALAVTAAVCLVSLALWEWFHKDPIIDVRMFRNLNFLTANVIMFMLGVVLFSSLVLLPQFLQTLMGYSATAAGIVLSTSGLVLLLEMPVVGQLTTRVPAKYLVSFGWLLIAIGMYYTISHLDLLISSTHAQWLRVAQAGAIGFVFVPITLAAYTGIPPEKSNSAAGTLNFMRNIGSSVGTSMVTTLIARRSQVHLVTLSAHATTFNPQFRQAVDMRAQRVARAGRGFAGRAPAYAGIYGTLISQAATLAYIDVFSLLAILAALMCVLSLALKKNQMGAAHAAVE